MAEEFHVRLKRFRIAAGFSSVREAAQKIGVPETTYREWEYGRAIRGEPYPQIASAYNVTLNELFGVDEYQGGSVEKDFNRILSDLKQLKKRVLDDK